MTKKDIEELEYELSILASELEEAEYELKCYKKDKDYCLFGEEEYKETVKDLKRQIADIKVKIKELVNEDKHIRKFPRKAKCQKIT